MDRCGIKQVDKMFNVDSRWWYMGGKQKNKTQKTSVIQTFVYICFSACIYTLGMLVCVDISA